MSASGINNPNSVDFVICSEDVFRLAIYETRQLVDQDASALQQKLNNYLMLAEGEHKTRYPESENKQLCIMVDLYAQPTPYIMEIFKQFKSKAAAYNVSLELAINGELVITRSDTPVQPAVSASRRQVQHRAPMSRAVPLHAQAKAKKPGARQLYL